MIKVALVSGFWSQNIGNGFFNVGGKWVLEQIFGEGNVQFIQDSPSYRTFYNQKNGNPKNFASLYERLDIDYLVLQGPCMTSTMSKIWEPTFKYLPSRWDIVQGETTSAQALKNRDHIEEKSAKN